MQPLAPGSDQRDDQPPNEDLLAALESDQPADAARSLIDRATRDPRLAERLRARLVEGSPEVRRALLDAIASTPIAPESLWPAIPRVTLEMSPDRRPLGLRAASAVPTRQAAFLLLSHAAPEHPPAIREAAFAGLRRLSGRSDLGADLDRWQGWYLASLSMNGREWTQHLLRERAARTEDLSRRVGSLSERLADAHRRLYLARSEEQRPAFLAELLASDVDEVRSMAIELVRQRLASGDPVTPAVSDAALALLRDERADVRAEAARLVRQVGPEGATDAILEALQREREPRAAEALLAAAARWPDPRAREPAFRWLEAEGEVASVAAELLWRLYREGALEEVEAQRRTLALLRRHDPAMINGAGCRLLVELGDDSDRQRVAELLSAERIDLKLSAARALAARAEYVPAIVDAVARDERLLDTAVRAIRQHMPNREGFRLLAELEPSSSDAIRRGLLEIASDLSTQDLVRVSEEPDWPATFRESLLSMLTSSARVPPDQASPDTRQAFASGLLQLARLRLDLDRPADALSALTFGEPMLSTTMGRDVAPVRVEALLRLGRLEEAAEIKGVGPIPWLNAIEGAEVSELMERLIGQARDRFGDSLSEAQRERLTAAVQRLRADRRQADASDAPAEEPDDSSSPSDADEGEDAEPEDPPETSPG